MERRDWLKQTAVGSMVLMGSPAVSGEPQNSYEVLLEKLTEGQAVRADDRVSVLVQAHAPNGAVVPVGVSSRVPRTQHIYILVTEHEHICAADMQVDAEILQPTLATHLQLLKPAIVTALVKSESGWYSASAPVESLGDSCEQRG